MHTTIYLRNCLFALILVGVAACHHKGETPVSGLIDQQSLDSSIRPQDDFYRYANEAWIQKTDIPASQIGWGAFFSLDDLSLHNLKTILDSLSSAKGLQANTSAQRVADLYSSIMDSAFMQSKGLSPVQSDLTQINAVQDLPGLLAEIARETTQGIRVMFTLDVGADDRNSLKYFAQFSQGGMGLPTKDYYFKQDSSIKRVREAYVHYMTQVFVLTGVPPADAQVRASQVLNAETALAKVSRDPVALRDPISNYHKLSVDQCNALTPGIHWNDFLGKLDIKTDSVLMGQPEFFTGMDKALGTVPLNVWKDYLTFHLINNYSSVLDSNIRNVAFAYTMALTGRKHPMPRWRLATILVDRYLGDDLGKMYVQKYFPPEAKERIQQLVNNLQTTFAARIQQLDWMSDSTKKKALIKLHAIQKKVGYPDKWKDYAGVHIDKTDAVGNIKSCATYEYMRKAKKVGQPVDRSEWFATTSTVDAYYNPNANDITFPAGILQPPFFFANGDDALNYGGIGIVIGHEMTHGFDDQGRQYDENGNMRDWWSSGDSMRFMQKADLMVRQYSHYLSVDTFHLNGKLTLGENIADNGGVAIAYAAFKNTSEGKDTALRIDGLTPDQRFFRSFAQVWKLKMRPELLRIGALNDPHSTAQFRVNGTLSNLDAFYQTYDVKPGDEMYLADSLRANIW
jgi:putative endopeptidase